MKLIHSGTAVGAFTGQWSLDAEKKILTIGNQQLIVRDAYNWEGSPRKATLVLSGITSNGRSVWGKQIR